MFNSRNSGLNALLYRKPPSNLEQLLSTPTSFLARVLYNSLPARPIPEVDTSKRDPLTVVCISDTHNTKPDLPPGDLLLHAGDLTVSGTPAELHDALSWLASQPHRYKVVIAGNHDTCLDSNHRSQEKAAIDWESLFSNHGVVYLQDTATTLHFPTPVDRTIKVYGSPKTRKHGSGGFQYAADKNPWVGVVPVDTDILLTHGPPKYHLDLSTMLGCRFLLEEIWKVRPALHVFGHIHAGYGMEVVCWNEAQRVYEKVCGGKKWGLVKMMGLWVKDWVARIFKRKKREGQTVLVNAAAFKGARDELRNEPFVVCL